MTRPVGRPHGAYTLHGRPSVQSGLAWRPTSTQGLFGETGSESTPIVRPRPERGFANIIPNMANISHNLKKI